MNRARLVVALWGLSAGCVAGLPQARPVDVGAAQAEWPGTTEADLDRGRTAYLGRCGACHRLHRPREVAAANWPGVLAKMGPRANLPSDESTDILRYLVILSSAAD